MVELIDYRVFYSELECVYLDLNVVSILGFEKEKNWSCIEYIIKGIKEKSEFPPVFLVPAGELEYRLTCLRDYCNETNLGGHNRVLAHYFENKPLRSLILNPEFVELYNSAAGFSDFSPVEESIIK
jgi:hypothetical protein